MTTDDEMSLTHWSGRSSLRPVMARFLGGGAQGQQQARLGEQRVQLVPLSHREPSPDPVEGQERAWQRIMKVRIMGDFA